jgi:5-aminolevulinate synthase
MKPVFDPQSFFASELDKLREEGRYRVFAELERCAGHFPKAKRYVKGEVSDVTMIISAWDSTRR